MRRMMVGGGSDAIENTFPAQKLQKVDGWADGRTDFKGRLRVTINLYRQSPIRIQELCSVCTT